MVDLRWLRVAATTEAATLLVLLVNLATVHAGVVSSLAGPLHGLVWLATIAIAFLVPVPREARLRSVVPGIGGLLAVRAATRAEAHRCDP